MKFLMCKPEYYGIAYEINPWMNLKCKVDHDLASTQWDKLYQVMTHCGAEILLISPASDWPDMVFTANAGLFYQNSIVLSHFKYKERQGESPYYQAWFAQAGFDLLNLPTDTPSPYFEGAGDALLAGEQLFVAFGFRSERSFYEKASYFDQRKLVYCELVNPYFYHLDTCFCPLNDHLAICYLDAFNEGTQKKLADHIELIFVNEEEAKQFACNAVVIDQHVILPTQCPKLSLMLQKKGFEVHACDMSEYLKAGGACKCLTLRLDSSD